MAPAGRGTGSTPSGTSKGRPSGLAFGSGRHGAMPLRGGVRAASLQRDLRSRRAQNIILSFSSIIL
ncbi:MAG TPA: hypothetical protein VLX68_02620 [Chitinivibrionales bacterium]|nr:hypothetical protein [Chitinivibrionales bacterium]